MFIGRTSGECGKRWWKFRAGIYRKAAQVGPTVSKCNNCGKYGEWWGGMCPKCAAELAEPALHNHQHSNGAEPAEICPHCGGSNWRIDGQHSNEFCSKCFTSKPGKLRHC